MDLRKCIWGRSIKYRIKIGKARESKILKIRGKAR